MNFKKLSLVFALVFGLGAVAYAHEDPRGHHEHATHHCIQKVMSGAVEWAPGQTVWQQENARSLCEGTRQANAPVACFMALLPGCTVEYAAGQSCNWQWQNAVALCRGTSNAFETLRCFDAARTYQRMNWEQAIANCAGRF